MFEPSVVESIQLSLQQFDDAPREPIIAFSKPLDNVEVIHQRDFLHVHRNACSSQCLWVSPCLSFEFRRIILTDDDQVADALQLLRLTQVVQIEHGTHLLGFPTAWIIRRESPINYHWFKFGESLWDFRVNPGEWQYRMEGGEGREWNGMQEWNGQKEE